MNDPHEAFIPVFSAADNPRFLSCRMYLTLLSFCMKSAITLWVWSLEASSITRISMLPYLCLRQDPIAPDRWTGLLYVGIIIETRPL